MPDGQEQICTAMIEDRSSSGVGVQISSPVELGTPARVIGINQEFTGVVMRCVPLESGFLVGMRGEWRARGAPKDLENQPIWNTALKPVVPQRPAEKRRTAQLRTQHKRFSDPTMRMQFMLDAAAQASDGRVVLQNWRTSEQFASCQVRVPEMKPYREEGEKESFWRELEKTQAQPLAPSAVFSVRFPKGPEGRQVFHFCYEADPGVQPLTEVVKKLRGYYHLIERQRLQEETFGVDRVDAVLVETTGEPRARKLMEQVRSSAVSGSGAPASVFWFTISPLFTAVLDVGDEQRLPACLVRPEMVFEPLWVALDFTRHALGENSQGEADARL